VIGVPVAGVVAPVVLASVVVPTVVLPEDLHADAREMVAITVPPAVMPTRCKNCRLENVVTLKIFFFARTYVFLLSGIFDHLEVVPCH
jgi:hypothetical protein